MLIKTLKFLFSKMIGNLSEEEKKKLKNKLGELLHDVAVASAQAAIEKNIK